MKGMTRRDCRMWHWRIPLRTLTKVSLCLMGVGIDRIIADTMREMVISRQLWSSWNLGTKDMIAIPLQKPRTTIADI